MVGTESLRLKGVLFALVSEPGILSQYRRRKVNRIIRYVDVKGYINQTHINVIKNSRHFPDYLKLFLF